MSQIEATITSLGAGGDGVGRLDDGRVVFVPRTAPGDRVRGTVVQAKKQWVRAHLDSVLEPGPGRIAPACAAFVAGCGGCQWQHLDGGAQVAAKSAIVAGALRHAVAAGLVLRPMLTPVPSTRWRRRARVASQNGQLGFRKEESHDVIAFADCVQLDAALEGAVIALRQRAWPDGELSLLSNANGDVVVRCPDGVLDIAADTALLGRGGIVGITDGTQSIGTPGLALEPGVMAQADDFAQASAAGNQALIALVLDTVGANPGKMLELYAGTGNFTRGLLGRATKLDVVDVVKNTCLAPHLRVHVGDVGKVLPRLPISTYDWILVDPPRVGLAADVSERLAAAQRIVYVSCDAATLGRDLGKLMAGGLKPRWAQPFDLMPQTSHSEIVVLLERDA